MNKTIKNIRTNILKLTYKAQSSHIGSCLSIVEILFTLYNKILKKKDNSIDTFVKLLKKKINLLYLDEFQVTNIVDAMILGKLFESIFKEKIKVLISSNIKIKDLYTDGLQREQFVPFIKIIKKYSIEYELKINQDYYTLSYKVMFLYYFYNYV